MTTLKEKLERVVYFVTAMASIVAMVPLGLAVNSFTDWLFLVAYAFGAMALTCALTVEAEMINVRAYRRWKEENPERFAELKRLETL